jgi:hypothetical protein
VQREGVRYNFGIKNHGKLAFGSTDLNVES